MVSQEPDIVSIKVKRSSNSLTRLRPLKTRVEVLGKEIYWCTSRRVYFTIIFVYFIKFYTY